MFFGAIPLSLHRSALLKGALPLHIAFVCDIAMMGGMGAPWLEQLGLALMGSGLA